MKRNNGKRKGAGGSKKRSFAQRLKDAKRAKKSKQKNGSSELSASAVSRPVITNPVNLRKEEARVSLANLRAKPDRRSEKSLISIPDGGDRCIGVLFLIIDELPHEEVWRAWTQTGRQHVEVERDAKGNGSSQRHTDRSSGRDLVNFWVHAKYPDQVRSKWVRDHLVPFTHKPEWGDVRLTRAMIDTLGFAVKEVEGKKEMKGSVSDHCCERFIFASESCLPITTLRTACNEMWNSEHSWIDAYHKPNNGYATQNQWGKVDDKVISKEFIWKGDQWFMLTRKHAKIVCSLPSICGYDLWRCFNKLSASDEIYFPTMLALAGILTPMALEREWPAPAEYGVGPGMGPPGVHAAPSPSSETLGDGKETGTSRGERETQPGLVWRRKVTMMDWSESSRNPRAFASVTDGMGAALIAQARERGCLFARKFKDFSRPLTGEKWKSWINSQ